MNIQLSPIGIIHSPHRQAAGTPVQPVFARDLEGTLEVYPEYAPGLKDLDGFDRAWLLYWFDRASAAQLVVTPFLDVISHGVFATRSPSRPNPIGISCVRIRRIDGNVATVVDLDILDGTPLLDIKPYVPSFDAFAPERIGWFAKANPAIRTADNRFEARNGTPIE